MSLLKHYLLPLVVITCGPILTQFLANYARDEGLEGFKVQMLFGNAFSWTIVSIWLGWCAFYLIIPFDRYKGPQTYLGYHPEYSNNCAPLYVTTFFLYLGMHTLWPLLSVNIYKEFPYMIGTLNVIAFALSCYLWWRGKYHPEIKEELEETSTLSEFCSGLELHPREFNTDIKQWMIPRVAWMGWLLIVFSFTMASYFKHGFSAGILVNFALQLYYLHKFYDWEPGYLTTLDMTTERAGFYLCWGTLAFMPSLYTYSTYYFVNHPPENTYFEALSYLLFGMVVITIKYMIDNEKDLFKETNGNCVIWGKKARFIEVEYKNAIGVQKSRLLTSGFWGLARHMNYFFEILCALSWTIVGYQAESIQPYFYVIFLTALLLHRLHRDEKKCSEKYGTHWEHYCKLVKYRMIPYVF